MNEKKRFTAEFYESDGNPYGSWHRYAFSFLSAARDGKDLVDIAIREWKGYYARKNNRPESTWLCVQVWGYDFAGNYCCYGKRYSQRCPASLKAY